MGEGSGPEGDREGDDNDIKMREENFGDVPVRIVNEILNYLHFSFSKKHAENEDKVVSKSELVLGHERNYIK